MNSFRSYWSNKKTKKLCSSSHYKELAALHKKISVRPIMMSDIGRNL